MSHEDAVKYIDEMLHGWADDIYVNHEDELPYPPDEPDKHRRALILRKQEIWAWDKKSWVQIEVPSAQVRDQERILRAAVETLIQEIRAYCSEPSEQRLGFLKERHEILAKMVGIK